MAQPNGAGVAATDKETILSTVNADLRDILALMRAGQWNAAHDRVQHHEGLLAAWLHGLLHLQEGDLEDAENWYDWAGQRFRQRGTLEEEMLHLEEALDPPL